MNNTKKIPKRMPNSHPISVEISMPAENFFRFCQLSESSDEINIVGHDDPNDDGIMTVYVACINEEIGELLEDAWL